MKKYDYIFIGAGCAGLSLLTRMVAEGIARGKKILLVDRAPKQKNDRTWCFWEEQPGFFEPVVCKKWDHVWFYSNEFSASLATRPYQYKMIRGIDFYDHCFKIIQQEAGIDYLYGEITGLLVTGTSAAFRIADQVYQFEATVVFNSVYNEAAARRQNTAYLLQHFKGWMLESPQPFFKEGEATLMDFRVNQVNGTTFAYVLPLSSTKALVEYTLFSEKVLPDQVYHEALTEYIKSFLKLTSYTITEEEFGVIPMTGASFPWFADGMYHIGTAGGQTKASSGYTFRFIQKQTAEIVQQIKRNALSAAKRPGAVSRRFPFYDRVLLKVLTGKSVEGRRVFSSLFKKNKIQSIFRFLDNESPLAEDVRIISSLPTAAFLKAAFDQLTGR